MDGVALMSEHGFWHPEYGYWQTISDPDEATLAAQPEGTVEIPLKPGADYEWNGVEWVHMPPDPAVLKEHERAGMVVSRFQAKAALLEADLLSEAETAVAQADPVVQLAWEEAVEFRRTSPAIAAIGAALDLTDEDIDDLFVTAAGIEA